jgi:hypothetical protein
LRKRKASFSLTSQEVFLRRVLAAPGVRARGEFLPFLEQLDIKTRLYLWLDWPFVLLIAGHRGGVSSLGLTA